MDKKPLLELEKQLLILIDLYQRELSEESIEFNRGLAMGRETAYRTCLGMVRGLMGKCGEGDSPQGK